MTVSRLKRRYFTRANLDMRVLRASTGPILFIGIPISEIDSTKMLRDIAERRQAELDRLADLDRDIPMLEEILRKAKKALAEATLREDIETEAKARHLIDETEKALWSSIEEWLQLNPWGGFLG